MKLWRVWDEIKASWHAFRLDATTNLSYSNKDRMNTILDLPFLADCSPIQEDIPADFLLNVGTPGKDGTSLCLFCHVSSSLSLQNFSNTYQSQSPHSPPKTDNFSRVRKRQELSNRVRPIGAVLDYWWRSLLHHSYTRNPSDTY